MSDNLLYVIVGQTATGKSDRAIEIAKSFGTEVVSADSVQVYQGLEFLTFPPSPEEMKEVRHHFISFISPKEEFNVARYLDLARPVVEALWKEGKPVVVVGGTGLYVKVLLEGLFPFAGEDPELRRTLLARDRGELYRELCKVDPVASQKIHPNDLRRIVRALEVYYSTGRPISYWWQRREGGIGRLAKEIVLIVHFAPREVVHKRIKARLARLSEEDVERFREISSQGLSKTARKVLGVEEMEAVLKGEMDLETARERLAHRTYQYARRQAIWFRKHAKEMSSWPNAKVQLVEIDK